MLHLQGPMSNKDVEGEEWRERKMKENDRKDCCNISFRKPVIVSVHIFVILKITETRIWHFALSTYGEIWQLCGNT